MSESTLVEAKALITAAIEAAVEIKPAGAQSLLAIAARALNPERRLTLAVIAETLGLHPSVVVSIAVASDLAGDTEARKEYGLALFDRLQLQALPPQLKRQGQLTLAEFCLQQLSPMGEVLGARLLPQTLELVREAARGAAPARGQVLELQSQATELQRLEVVGVGAGKKKAKEMLGISDEQRFQRHAAQALRAALQACLEPEGTEAALITVAGEVPRALGAGLGFAAAAGFTLDLAYHLAHELPGDQRIVAPIN